MAVIADVGDPWLSLRNAIIEQAAEDYREGFSDAERVIRTQNKTYQKNAVLQRDAEKFFNSRWCEDLLAMDASNVTGPDLMDMIRRYDLEDIKKGQRKAKMKVKLIQQTPNPINVISTIASICYDSRPTNRPAMVKMLYLNGHHSPFEHVYFTWHIEGISRACSHQLVRHRLCAFTQRSQRYVEENGFDYVLPDGIDMKDSTRERYKQTMDTINDTYCDMIHMDKIRKEDARFLLPNACTTEMYLSCNLRELIHICNERLCSRAQWEIRKLVFMMVAQVDESIRWMLVPKCESGFSICNDPCRGSGYKLMGRRKDADKT